MTKIGWVNVPGYKPESWNLWHGCTKKSPGCQNCWAELVAKNRLKTVKKYNGEIRMFPYRTWDPLYWKKPRMVFVNSMSDLFHENVPFEIIEDIFEIMYKAKKHIFQILTKRPERMLEYLKWQSNIADGYLIGSNVWLGVSVESPEYLHRIETLLEIPAAVRFVSFEPLLSDMGDLGEYLIDFTDDNFGREIIYNLLDWIICGCESGPRRRPCKLEWVYSIVEQCQNADVPVFVK